MLNVRLLVKDLDEVEVAVVGLLQLVQRELEVDLLLLLTNQRLVLKSRDKVLSNQRSVLKSRDQSESELGLPRRG